MHDDIWTLTNMATKIGSSTFYTWGLKSIHWSYIIHTCFPIIASNMVHLKFKLPCNKCENVYVSEGDVTLNLNDDSSWKRYVES